MELFQISSAAFSEILYELIAIGERMKCIMKHWEVSIFIPIYKKNELILVPANNRPLRLIFILRKIFGIETMVKIVKSCPDELEQYGFNYKLMALKSVAMALSNNLAALCDKYFARCHQSLRTGSERSGHGHSRQEAQIRDCKNDLTLLQPSTVTTMGEETEMSEVVNVGLTHGDPASPALDNKTKNILIRRVLHALKIVDDENFLVPPKAFANEIYLQLASDVAAKLQCERRAAGWLTCL